MAHGFILSIFNHAQLGHQSEPAKKARSKAKKARRAPAAGPVLYPGRAHTHAPKTRPGPARAPRWFDTLGLTSWASAPKMRQP